MPLQLTGDDDNFHRPTNDDPWWQETSWFTVIVPERKLTCYVYPWVRANQSLFGGGVIAWDDSGRLPHHALHWDYAWNHPYPELGDLRNVTFPNGLHIECLEPLTRYHITYDHPSLALDVTFDALVEPHVAGGDDDSAGSGAFRAHLDQQGHVVGRIAVGGEEHAVDCYTMRDRSWGRRVPIPGLHTGYDLATSAEEAFVVLSMPDVDGSPIVPGFGYLWREGESATWAEGTRVLEWRDGWPTRLIIKGKDTLGRSVEGVGECINHMCWANIPTMLNYVSTLDFHFEGGGVAQQWGELQEVFEVERYRSWWRAQQ